MPLMLAKRVVILVPDPGPFMKKCIYIENYRIIGKLIYFRILSTNKLDYRREQ